MASVFKSLNKKSKVDKQGKKIFEEEIDSSSSEDSQKSDQGDNKKVETVLKESQSDRSSDKNDQEEQTKVDSEDELRAFKDPEPASKEWKNRQRTLVACSRGVSGKFRYLINDIIDMIPNTKKESKLDRK